MGTRTGKSLVQVRSFAGALSFVAGVVPHLRPFLASLWVVIAQANDRGKAPGKLVHTRRIGQALKWISAFLGGENSLTRVVMARRQMSGHSVFTDASTFGMGGVLIEGDSPRECFSIPIPGEFILRFKASTGDPRHMALWESLTLLVAARLWLVRFPLGTVVRVRSDNISALYMVLKCKAKSPALAIVAREIAMDQARSLYQFTSLKRINTKDNIIANSLSRQFEPKPAPFPPELGGCRWIPVYIESNFWQVPS